MSYPPIGNPPNLDDMRVREVLVTDAIEEVLRPLEDLTKAEMTLRAPKEFWDDLYARGWTVDMFCGYLLMDSYARWYDRTS